jgi:hypothetical protein
MPTTLSVSVVGAVPRAIAKTLRSLREEAASSLFPPPAPGCDVPGAASIRVFVAVYTLDPDGVARLHHKTEDRVSAAKPTVTLPLDLPRSCSLFWVGGHGDVVIPATLAAPAPDPTKETLGAPFDFGLPDRIWDVMPPC